MQSARKNFALVGGSILIKIFKNKDLVIHFRLWLPVWVGLHRGHPESPLIVKIQSHGVCEFWKLFFGCDELNLESVVQFKQFQLLLRCQVIQ